MRSKFPNAEKNEDAAAENGVRRTDSAASAWSSRAASQLPYPQGGDWSPHSTDRQTESHFHGPGASWDLEPLKAFC